MPDSEPNRSTDLSFIAAVAREAADLALRLQAEGVGHWHKDDNTPVSDADLAVDNLLRERLQTERPDYGWLSEESDRAAGRPGGRTFIIDPIDGTRAFLNGRDTWTICIAVADNHGIESAAIARPARGDIYTAERGTGAHLNGNPLRVSHHAEIAGAKLAGGQGVYALAPQFADLTPPVEFVGATSMALRLCLVADGSCDATAALSAKSDWDLAAGMLLVHEAGGLVTDSAGTPISVGRHRRHATVAAANPRLHDALLAALSKTDLA